MRLLHTSQLAGLAGDVVDGALADARHRRLGPVHLDLQASGGAALVGRGAGSAAPDPARPQQQGFQRRAALAVCSSAASATPYQPAKQAPRTGTPISSPRARIIASPAW